MKITHIFTSIRQHTARLTLLCTTIAAIALLSGCSSDEPEAKCGRSVLVYMAADNSLGASGYDSNDLDEMLHAARNGDLGNNRLIVYHASRSEAPALKEITSHGIVTLKNYDYSQSSVSVARMSQVFADFKSMAPAKAYGLILWSHASGWIQNGIDESATLSPKSWGDDRGKHANIPSLTRALEGQQFDYIYFDCCFMANIESLYQLRHVTPVAVASTTELPADGMPYDLTIKYLVANNPDLAKAAKATFDYYDSLQGADRTCTISVIDMTRIDALAQATKDVFLNWQSEANYAPQQFMVSGCYLYDMADYIKSQTIDPDLKRQWIAAFNDAVTLSLATPKLWNHISLDRANGLSCYILTDETESSYRGYDELEWWSDVGQFQFCK